MYILLIASRIVISYDSNSWMYSLCDYQYCADYIVLINSCIACIRVSTEQAIIHNSSSLCVLWFFYVLCLINWRLRPYLYYLMSVVLSVKCYLPVVNLVDRNNVWSPSWALLFVISSYFPAQFLSGSGRGGVISSPANRGPPASSVRLGARTSPWVPI